MRALDRLVAVRAPRDGDLADLAGRLGVLDRGTCVVPLLDEVRVRLDGDEVVGQPGEPRDRLPAGDRDADRHLRVRDVPELRGVDAEVRALVRQPFPGEQLVDDLEGLLEHVVPLPDRGPALPDDVLVEVLPGPDVEHEPALGEQRERRGLLRDDRRVVPDRRAGHVGHQLEALGRLRDGAEHAPRVRRVPLRVEPREVVVGRHREVEPEPVGVLRVPDELTGAGLLGHEGVPESRHASRVDLDDASGIPNVGARRPGPRGSDPGPRAVIVDPAMRRS